MAPFRIPGDPAARAPAPAPEVDLHPRSGRAAAPRMHARVALGRSSAQVVWVVFSMLVTLTVNVAKCTYFRDEPCAFRTFRHQSNFLSAAESSARRIHALDSAAIFSGNSGPETCAMRRVRRQYCSTARSTAARVRRSSDERAPAWLSAAMNATSAM